MRMTLLMPAIWGDLLWGFEIEGLGGSIPARRGESRVTLGTRGLLRGRVAGVWGGRYSKVSFPFPGGREVNLAVHRCENDDWGLGFRG